MQSKHRIPGMLLCAALAMLIITAGCTQSMSGPSGSGSTEPNKSEHEMMGLVPISTSVSPIMGPGETIEFDVEFTASANERQAIFMYRLFEWKPVGPVLEPGAVAVPIGTAIVVPSTPRGPGHDDDTWIFIVTVPASDDGPQTVIVSQSLKIKTANQISGDKYRLMMTSYLTSPNGDGEIETGGATVWIEK